MSSIKARSKQALTILLAFLLLFAMVPNTLAGGVAYAADNSTTYLELYTDSTATETTDEYTLGDDFGIYLRTNSAEADEYWPWVGIYSGELTPETWSKSQLAMVWAYAESAYGDQTVSYNTDTAYNILAEGNYTADSNTNLNFTPGTYTAILFKDYDNYGPVAYKQFTINPPNTNTITTDKDTYALNEPIMVTANFTGSGYFWVGLYGKDENPDGGPQSYYWYDGHNNEAYNIKAGTKNRELVPGEYKVILFGDSGYTNEVATKNITITKATTITTDKDIYAIGEPIMVTATSAVEGVWVALLGKNDAVDAQSYYYYYVADHDGEPFNIYEGTKSRPADITDGEYKLLIIQESSSGAYVSLAEKDIFIGTYVEPSIALNKEGTLPQYKYGEQVLITAQGSDSSAWFGVYDYEPTFPSGYYVYYYIKDVTESIDLVKAAADAGKPLKYGEKYRIYLCINEDGNPNSIQFTKSLKFELLETYGDPTWVWGENNLTATATFTAMHDATLTKTVTVTGDGITSEVTKEPSEEEEGIRTYTATITADMIDFVTANDAPFTASTTEAIPKLNHVHNCTLVEATAPTCTETGNTAYYKCSGCGLFFEDEEATKPIEDKSKVVIAATGHAWGDWVFDVETKTHTHVCANDPTHTETENCTFTHEPSSDPYTETYTCTVCHGQYEQATVPVITTDKTEYEEGENIYVTTELNGHDGSTSGGWIALQYKGESYGNKSLLWYYPACFENPKLLQSVLTPSNTNWENVNGDRGTDEWDEIPVGEYELVFLTSGYNTVPGSKPAYFTVKKAIESETVTKEPTCTEEGIKHIVYKDGTEEDVAIPALGHDPKEAWVHDPETRTHYHECTRCDAHVDEAPCAFDEGTVTKEATVTEEGEMLYTCTVCGGTYTEVIPTLMNQGVKRIYGSGRYETAILQANELKETLGIEKFDTIIVATGNNFADALSGAYLGYVKKAPILLVYPRQDIVDMVQNYIKENLAADGTVYILGGEAVVPADIEAGIKENFTTKRLFGNNRYDTNIEILKEVGVGSLPILVCDGNNYADSLSASAAKLPILVVNKKLNDAQKEYLKSLPGNDYTIVGGEVALPTTLMDELNEYGKVARLGGADRCATSVMVAQAFFENPEKAVVAYALNYPDGLCGGTVAAYMDAPLLLTYDGKKDVTAAYTADAGIKSGIVLGGSGLVSDESVRAIFSMAEEDVIYEVTEKAEEPAAE